MRCEVVFVVAVLCCSAAGCATRSAADEPTLAERRERLAQMSDAEKTRLLQQKKRFDELSREEQEKYRQLHDELVADPREEQLRATLKRYSDWLKTLTPGDRAELAKLPVNERLEHVRELMEAQATERFRQMISEAFTSHDLLSREDRDVICQWTDEFLGKHAQEVLDTVPDTVPFLEIKANFDLQIHIHFLRFWFFRQAGWGPGPGPGGHGFPPGPPGPPGEARWPSGPGPGVAMSNAIPSQDVLRKDRPMRSESDSPARDGLGGPPPGWEDQPSPSVQRIQLLEASPDDIEDLAKRVSPQARKILSKAQDERERVQIVEGWMLAAFLGRFMPSREELDRFVRESLDPQDRKSLEQFPRDRMYEELQKLYFRKRFEWRRRGMGPRPRDGFGDPGGRPRWGESAREPGPPPRGEPGREGSPDDQDAHERPPRKEWSPDRASERKDEPGGGHW